MAPTGTKRKGPPTFHHLPADRAKKLKKAWIENKKVKSKWRAEKRKQAVQNPVEEPQREEEEGEKEVSSSSEDETTSRPSNKQPEPPTPRNPTANTQPSLRELAKDAYSPSSLHSFKSDPLQRRKGHGDRSQQGRGRGRGQPNMKLRMGLMLEKIKQNLT